MLGENAIESRKKRIEKALEILQKTENLNYVKAMNLISFELGVRTDTAREYINILKELGKIEVNDSFIKVKR